MTADGENIGTMSKLYGDDTPDSIKNSKGLHLITQSTPNGQKVQIMLEELKEAYGTEWDTTLIVRRGHYTGYRPHTDFNGHRTS